ncbi:hypothetical protein OsI_23491 [Oryza sativa Indica Group]|uniref:non-specific serine/threonine protein kinase n=1 Tax=Oryza sativa subsp. indica TaxID=39946 RepID=B8B433_ORYSI|nr:hypothetical protein OsI_23491 [Oryza sativa Indica Group]
MSNSKYRHCLVATSIRSRLPLAVILSYLLSFFASSSGATTLYDQPSIEFQSLLCLKLHLTSTDGILATWKNDSHQFCDWSGVTCSKRNSSRVVALELESFDLDGQIPPCIANLTFLTRIHLADNQLSGEIPRELGQLNKLQYLNLSSNKLRGKIPDTLSSCHQLQTVDLGSNILQGEIPQNLRHCLNLQVLNLDFNMLTGGIPEELGMLQNLSVLHLAGNSLTGGIPLSLGSTSSLVSVILANNSLTGPIPSLLANSSSLQVLSLTRNHLTGEIPPALFNSTSLRKLALGVNNFVGTMPTLMNIDSPLQYFIVQSNDLAGTIPSTIGNFSSLLWLLLGANNFEGSIPTSIGTIPDLQILDFSYNLLSGTVPASIYNMSELTYLGMGKNSLTGKIPYSIGYTLPSIQTLIMQANQFQGQIPISLANGTNLVVINLRDNAFQGVVPSFGTLPNLVELDLGKNRLEAGDWSFLSSLTNCTQLVRLLLDSNILEGVLPGPGKYGSVYRGVFEFEQQVVAIKVFKLDQHGGPKSFLAECEALRNTRHRNLVSVITACSTFDPIGHEFKALILDYMPNGNLENWLHLNHITYGLNIQLSFASRITIAADIAAALDYLHNYCVPPIVHCDLKPSNVLIDDAMGARLGDFGLSKFLHSYSSSTINSSTSLAGPRGSIGYIAPEYGFGSKISTEGDVYSYGIIILEMLTGKRPTDGMFNDGMSLHKFVEKAFPHNIGKIIDPNIMPNLEDEQHYHETVRILSCITQLAKLGLSCSVEIPKDRPVMQEVYAEVVEIKETFLELQG